MELKQLLYFITIVEEGGVCAAARKLYISQPPVTYQLRRLEEELGVKLLERNARQIVMTDAGRVFYQRAKRMLQLSEAAQQEMVAFGTGLSGTFHLGVRGTSSSMQLYEVLQRLHGQYPGLRFDVHTNSTYDLIEKLEAGIIEIAVVRTPFHADQYERVYLPQEPLVAVGHTRFFPSEAVRLPAQALQGMPLIVHKSYEAPLMRLCGAAGFDPHILCVANDAATRMLWAYANLGVAVVPQSMALTLRAQAPMQVRRIAHLRIHDQTAAIWKRDGYLSSVARAFLEMVQAVQDEAEG